MIVGDKPDNKMDTQKDDLNLDHIKELLEAETARRKLLEAKLDDLLQLEQQKGRQLAAETNNKSQFINVLSHELRTPLTPLIASAGLLEETFRHKANSNEYRLASLLLKGAHDLSRRLSDLLDVARLMNGKITLHLQEVDIRAIMLKTYSEYVVHAATRDQSLKIAVPDDLPTIEADKLRMEQMLANLVSNAINLNSIGKAVILRAKAKKQGLLIEVEDHGQALSDEEKEMIFQPYHQVQQDRSRFGGLGLGLAISKHIIETHHGIITLKQDNGRGNTFTVLLPLSQQEPIRN